MIRLSQLEEALALHIRVDKLPEPVREHKFHPVRRWKFDFAWPDQMLAVEVEGGHWNGGRHVTGKGFEQDCEKYEAALLEGWTVYRCTGSMVKSGRAIEVIKQLLQMAESKAA